MPENLETNLTVAERIAGMLADLEVPVVVIGAVALAAHRYVRFTEDIDLGVNASLIQMLSLTESLRSQGYEVEFHAPDLDAPLGGVIDVSGQFGLVQIVSFEDRFPAVIRDALHGEKIEMSPGSKLRIVPIPQLVALKLYAGGFSSRADIIELLQRNPQVDLEEINKICRGYGLRGFKEILDELGKDS